eukprot:scaffold201327_cov13-Tisochrysis_lutea.AAC.1
MPLLPLAPILLTLVIMSMELPKIWLEAKEDQSVIQPPTRALKCKRPTPKSAAAAGVARPVGVHLVEVAMVRGVVTGKGSAAMEVAVVR